MEIPGKNKYILIGIPGCGKSTLGKQAADILQLPFFDTDSMACERLSAKNPHDVFRAVLSGTIMTAQQDAIRELAAIDSSALIATGAEIALIPKCAALLCRMGTVIHVQRKPEIVLTSMANDDKSGLVLREMESGAKFSMRGEAVKCYAQELSRYEALADLTLDNDGSVEVGVEKLVDLICDVIGKH